MVSFQHLFLCIVFVQHTFGQVQKSTIDFSKAVPDPTTGQLCVTQQVNKERDFNAFCNSIFVLTLQQNF